MNISLFFISSIWKIKALEHDCHVCCPTYTSVSLIIKPVHVVHLWWCVWLILVKEPAALPTLKPDVVQTIVANVQLSSLMTTTTLSIVLQVSFNTKGRVSIGHSCCQSCDPFGFGNYSILFFVRGHPLSVTFAYYVVLKCELSTNFHRCDPVSEGIFGSDRWSPWNGWSVYSPLS